MEAKLSASIAKFREHTLKIRAARPNIVVIPIGSASTATVVPPTVKRAASEAKKCTARTLEGRQCPFNATCGGFCKKHFSMK